MPEPPAINARTIPIGCRRAVLLCLLATLATWCAAADGRGERLPRVPAGWRVGLGLAPVLSPVFEGADDYGFSVFPDLR
ncbi:MAG: hypothetical protein ACU85V_10950, partial [Gammaproteobacteria bacterium]